MPYISKMSAFPNKYQRSNCVNMTTIMGTVYEIYKLSVSRLYVQHRFVIVKYPTINFTSIMPFVYRSNTKSGICVMLLRVHIVQHNVSNGGQIPCFLDLSTYSRFVPTDNVSIPPKYRNKTSVSAEKKIYN